MLVGISKSKWTGW